MSLMSPHDLRERIEQILIQPGSVSADELQETAGTYARVIRELNQRLTICNRWLDAGLRSEAIHMATLDPDLLDALGQLDLGESLQQWVDLCSANGATVPPRANWELASFLNDAWDKESQLTDELRSLRLAMLTHRDVPTRLRCLRTLLSADHANAAWDTMTRQHEKLRIIELQSELQEASARDNLKHVALLTKEIQSSEWLEPPPADLLDVSSKVRKRVATQRVRQEYEKLADRLHAAMAAGDEAKALQWRGRWDDARSMSGMAPPEDIAATAIAVFDWLNSLEQQRNAILAHDLACRQLALGLDDQSPMEDLEPLRFRIQQMDAGIPELLEQRYQDRLQSEGRSRRAKLVFRACMLVVLLAAVGAGGWFAVGWYGDMSAAGKFETQLRSAISEGNVQLLEKLLERGHADFPDAMRDDLTKPVLQAEELIEEWYDQREECKQMLADLGGLSSTASITDTEMNRLKSICQTEEEKRQFALLKIRYDEAKAEVAQQSLLAFRTALDTVKLDFRHLKNRLHRDPTADLIDEAQSVLYALQDIESDLADEHVPPSEVVEMTSLQKEVKGVLDDLQQRESRVAATADLVERLRRPGQSLGEIIESLRMLRDNDQDFPHRREIKRTLEAADKLTGIHAWNSVRRQLPDNLRPAPAAAGSLALQLAKVPDNPIIDQQQLEDLAAWLGAIDALHHVAAAKPKEALGEFLDITQPWMHTRLWRLVTRGGVYFAMSKNDFKPPNNDNDPWDLGHVVLNNQGIVNGAGPGDFKGIDDNQRPAGVKPRDFKLQSTGLRQWLDNVKAQLTDAPDDATMWYLNLLDELAAIDSMEPSIRLAVAARLADLHQRYSWPPLPRLKAAAANPDILPPDDWPEPDAAKGRPSAVRAKASAIVDKLQPLDVRMLRREAQDATQSLVRNLPQGFEHVGLVWFDEAGNKKAFLDKAHQNLRGDHEIWALVDTSAGLKWDKVGQGSGDGIHLGNMARNVLPGMPLFATSSLQE